MMDIVDKPMQATPQAKLLGDLMNPNVPKNETEWAAFHHIEHLVSIVESLRQQKPADDTITLPIAEWEAIVADKSRVDWLNDNFYNANNAMDDMDKRLRPNKWACVFYAPKDTQSDVRKVLDAAIQGDSND
jgi:hypothetical protein